MDPAVPVVGPEISAEKITAHGGIVANPNCAAVIIADAGDKVSAGCKSNRGIERRSTLGSMPILGYRR